MESNLSFACDLIEAVPECACLYLSATDLLIPNGRWKAEVGDMTRLSDLTRIKVNPREVARLLGEREAGDNNPVRLPVDEQGDRSLLVSQVRGHENLWDR